MEKLSRTLSNLFKRPKGNREPVRSRTSAQNGEGEARGEEQSAVERGQMQPGGVLAKNVLFTRRAWTALMSEVLKEALTETGGILLGYRNGSEWVVVESIDPGPNSIFQVAYFEYDQPYITHLVNRVRNYYDTPLELLGLWHRHPGSFDKFSSTDDETNRSYASLCQAGAISGLVNIDPHFRFTLYRVEITPLNSIRYSRIPCSVLNEEDSARVARLRDVDELAAAIETSQTLRRAGVQDAPPVFSHNYTNLADVAKSVDKAIARRRDEQSTMTLTRDALAEWTEEQIETLLETLDSDVALFSTNGIELRIKLFDECRIELSAHFEGQNERLCFFVLAPMGPDSAEGPCILANDKPVLTFPYESRFFWRCLVGNA